MTTKYYAHSKENEPPINWQPLHEHLKNVAEMARSMLIGKLGNCRTDVRNAIPDDPSDEFPTCVGMNR